ncbi:phage holin family protein [Myxococcus sp. AM009]|uniref:phage holin family protein n=1 Tax=unclassified Myxococcus TaxID=2648731 RepID=UPI001594ED4C|nr:MULTISPECIES: phage holin family protein [unclassified Myxococcus]NVJ01551.1 phage holin family protein [Myxococcus sp. AM009]NVJ15055.1 phage holin family protein [Myxococcus sp. AM010]
MHVGSEQAERGISALVGRMADGFSRLVTQHLQLARMELAEDVKATGLDVAMIVAFVPFILVGYGFVCAALAAWLSTWLGWPGALAGIGLLNLVGGVGGAMWAVNRLKARRMMDDSSQELSLSVAALTNTAPAASANALQGTNSEIFKEPPHGR